MEDRNASQIKTISITNVILGFWIIIAPFILDYQTATSYWNSIIVGAIVVTFAAARFFAPSQTWTSWINAFAGLWLIVTPFFLGYQADAAYWNQIITGVIITTLSFMNVTGERSHTGHGHPA